ncbi:O-antigen polymerase [Ewingella sp. S1.OA.A_B6]
MSIFLLSPGFIYASVWLFTFSLYSLGLTTNTIAISDNVAFFIMANVFLGLLFSLLFIRNGSVSSIALSKTMPTAKSTKIMFIIWCVAVIPDVIVAGGIPMLMQLRGGYNYTEFGIPTYHGFVNMIFLFVFPAIYYQYICSKNKKLILILLGMCIWEMLVFRRGIIMSGLVEVSLVYFLHKRLTLNVFLKVFTALVLIIFLFGAVGDVRGAENPYSYLITDKDSVLNFLPSGFTWFYVYITAGMANLTYNFSHIIPVFDFTSFQDLFPSVIRNIIYPDLGFHDSMKLIDSNANVSTMFEKLLPDLGIFGSLMVVFLMLSLFSYAYQNLLKSYRFSIYPYAVAMQCVIFSGFYNLFFIQTYFLLFVITLVFVRVTLKRKNSVHTS